MPFRYLQIDMKKLLCALVATVLLCSACTTLQEEKNIDNLPLLPVNDAQIITPQEKSILLHLSLYGYDNAAGKLTVTAKEIETDVTDKASFVMQTLLEEKVKNAYLGQYRLEVTLEGAAVTGEIAQIHLKTNKQIEDQYLYILSAMITNTAIDNLGVKYVNLIINDSPLLIDGMPQGLLVRNGLNIQELYEQKRTLVNGSSENFEILLPIYYIDADTGYILPEVRNVQLSKDWNMEQVLYALLEQLASYTNKTGRTLPVVQAEQFGAKPDVEDEKSAIMDGEAVLAEEAAFSFEDGMLTFLSAEKYMHTDKQKQAAMACVYYTINAVIPDIREITFAIGGEVLTMSFSEAWPYIGSEIAIYLPKEDFSAMQKVLRAVPAHKIYAMETYIEELVRGPVGTEKEGLLPAFPAEASMDHFLWLTQEEDLLVINFSDELLRLLDVFSEQEQIMFVYTIVNTVCERENIKRVEFLFNGQRVSTLREQSQLTLQAPLLPNPGLIAK